MKNKRTLYAVLLIAIFLIGVAYSAITTTLSIGGSTSISGNSSNFSNNVKFVNASASSGSTATISSDGHTITFQTAQLKTVGSTATLTYSIKNESNYNASIGAVTCTSSDTSFATYVTATPSRTNTLSVNKNATSASETVVIEMIKSYAQTTAKNMTFTCSMEATAIGA